MSLNQTSDIGDLVQKKGTAVVAAIELLADIGADSASDGEASVASETAAALAGIAENAVKSGKDDALAAAISAITKISQRAVDNQLQTTLITSIGALRKVAYSAVEHSNERAARNAVDALRKFTIDSAHGGMLSPARDGIFWLGEVGTLAGKKNMPELAELACIGLYIAGAYGRLNKNDLESSANQSIKIIGERTGANYIGKAKHDAELEISVGIGFGRYSEELLDAFKAATAPPRAHS